MKSTAHVESTKSTKPRPSSDYRSPASSSPQTPRDISSMTANTQQLYTAEQVMHVVQRTISNYHQFQQQRGVQRSGSPRRDSHHDTSSADASSRRPHPYAHALSNHQRPAVMKPRIHAFVAYGSPDVMIITLELPGVANSDVSVHARPNNELVVRGLRHELVPKPDGSGSSVGGFVVHNELKFGQFERVFSIPQGTNPEHITANMNDGMLTITWPLPPRTRPTEQTSPNREVKQENDDDVTIRGPDKNVEEDLANQGVVLNGLGTGNSNPNLK